jgi:hypothetical protein
MRLTVRIPSYDRKLAHDLSWLQKHPSEYLPDANRAFAPMKRWWIYFGTIAPDRIADWGDAKSWPCRTAREWAALIPGEEPFLLCHGWFASLTCDTEVLMRTLTVLFATAAFVALTSSSPMAAQRSKTSVSDTPPHASTTGMDSRSSVASRHGANKRGFCPPGQKKKPGKGSAFNC